MAVFCFAHWNGCLQFYLTMEFDSEVILNGTVSAEFDIETFNGSIRNCFGPKPERTSRYSPGLGLSFTQGDGNGNVVIETLNGSVRICNE